MRKRKENKNDKLILFGACLLIVAFLSWIISASTYQSGQLVDIGMYRAGLYDIIAVIFSGLTYKIEDVIFILFVGGLYGVLSKAESYKKIVNSTVKFIKGKEIIAFAVITLLVGLYASISNNLMSLFFLAPFIMTVFLKSGYDKLTAVSAGFGGLFLGFLGQTFSTYTNVNSVSGSAVTFLFDNLSVKATDMIGIKFVIFFVGYVLFNVFAILHMRKNKNVELEENADMFEVGEVEKTTKKRDQIMTWPTVVTGVLALIVILLGYVSWSASFGVDLFSKVHTAVMDFAIADVKVMQTLIGETITAFGTWSNLFPALFALVFVLIVVAITNRISINTLIENFGEGVKKISKVAFMYGVSFAFLYLMSLFPWPTSLVDAFINPESFNIVFLLIAGFISVIFCADPSFSGYYFGSYLAAVYSANAAATALLWRMGGALALLLGPTSFILLTALTYADIPYKNWLKYIWKFALTFVIAALIVMAVAIYI